MKFLLLFVTWTKTSAAQIKGIFSYSWPSLILDQCGMSRGFFLWISSGGIISCFSDLGKLLSIAAFDGKYEKENFFIVVIMYNSVQCAAYVS